MPLVVVDELVRRAQRGDALAMSGLVRELTPYVGRICGAIALDEGDDAMQETFVAVLRNISGLREPAALHGWVRRIAVREAVRVAGRRLPVGELDNRAASVPSPEQIVDVRQTLERLEPHQRAVLVLRDVEGMTEAEAAAALGVPEGTVKSRLNRARAAFRKRWES